MNHRLKKKLLIKTTTQVHVTNTDSTVVTKVKPMFVDRRQISG